jgi:hypothetical protein
MTGVTRVRIHFQRITYRIYSHNLNFICKRKQVTNTPKGIYEKWGRGQTMRRLEEELDKDAVCHQCCLNCTANALTTEAFEVFWRQNRRTNY